MRWGTVDTRRGVNADRAFDESRQPSARATVAERALSADVATDATNATNATNVLKIAEKISLEDADAIALVTPEGEIQPVTLSNLLAFLGSRYVLTPIP